MGMFSGIIRRSNSDITKEEDDLTPEIKAFFENRKQENCTIRHEGENFLVTVDGDVHIYRDDLNDDGTLFFKLEEVTGNLVCHVRSISPEVVPDRLCGRIIFDAESIQENKPAQTASTNEVPEGGSFNGMEVLTATPPTESATRKKMESLISDCVEYNFNIDIEAILERMREEKLNSEKYKLRIEYEYPKYHLHKDDAFKRFDIYISDSDEDLLNLTPIEKAAYLTFLLYEEGVVLEDIKMDFVDCMNAIYRKLPDKVVDQYNGITGGNFSATTLRGYLSEIRSAIKDRIINNHLVEEFAIEGYKNCPFKIAKSTPEIRDLIRDIFNLQ